MFRTITLYAAAVAALSCTAWAQGTVTSATDLQGRGSRVAPGDPIIIRGANLTGGRAANAVTLTVGGKTCLLTNFTPTVVEATLPYDVPVGTQQVVLAASGTNILTTTMTVAAAAPMMLTDDWSPAGRGMIIRPNAPPMVLDNGVSLLQYVRVLDTARAVPGETVYVMTLGLGAPAPAPEAFKYPSRATRLSHRVTLETTGGKAMENVEAWQDADDFFRQVNRFLAVYHWVSVRFRIPADMPEGVHTLRINANGVAGNTVLLYVGKKTPLVTGIWLAGLDWFSFVGISPGSILSLFGLNFGPSGEGSASTFRVGDTRVEIAGKPAPIFGVYGSQGQMNILAPMDIPESGRLIVKVTTAEGSTEYPVVGRLALPSQFTTANPLNPEEPVHYAIATKANTVWLPWPAGMAQRLGVPTDCEAKEISPLSTCAAPVKPGDILQVYMTGLGRASTDGTGFGGILPTGTVAPASGSPLYQVVTPVTVRVGGVGAEVLFAGLTPGFAGLYQVNVRIPMAVRPGDGVEMQITTTLTRDGAGRRG
jgi:uncharacterized protein (TIGR03437 family)